MHRCLLAAGLSALLAAGLALTAPVDPADQKDRQVKKVAAASDDWKKTAQRLQLAKGLRAELWAAEPLVANLVAFAFDEKGRCYVAETFRLHNGVTDNRNHRDWLDDDLASRTVADRLAMYRKHLKDGLSKYEQDEDRVRLVEDTTGAGKADKSTVFAAGFKSAADGLGAGLLARGGKVWYTCIPNLWQLEDTKGTGQANVKTALHTGYGVHVAFIGHDLHGLKMGPDGKLYFSIGDRGLHVETEGRTLSAPDCGAVLRCNPDGSELEIVATGLRNPQELAFDQYGNLFTGDNNADGGDAARWVYVVEGGDSGWRIGYQYLPRLGVWNSEKLWQTAGTNTGAYLLPPLAHLANGPSGLTYHPGTSQLPERYREHFFLCDFRGGGAASGVHTFTMKPKGAAFELTGADKLVWSVLATDCDFGPDGAFYVSDWVDGWGMPNKGRLWKIADPDRAKDATMREVAKLLADGFAQRSTAELAKLLEHADMRVRQEAQFALAAQGETAALAQVAKTGSQLARLHAIWGLGQIGRRDGNVLPMISDDLLKDKDTEVRAQAYKVLGSLKMNALQSLAVGHNTLGVGLKDPQPRVRFFAAMAAARIGHAEPSDVLQMLRDNADQDAYLRHAGVMALAGLARNYKILPQAAEDPAPAVRLAALLAMRRLHLPEMERFLHDADGKLVLEAARAIYDEPIPAALPALAELTQRGSSVRTLAKDVQEPILLRAVAAHYRLGARENAAALAVFAGRGDVPEKVREKALELLLAWEKPSGRDPVVGLWRPLRERPAADVAEALRSTLGGILLGPDRIRAEGARLAAKHGIKEVGLVLRDLVVDTSRAVAVRVEMLRALEALRDAHLEEAARGAIKDADPRLRHQGRRILLAKTPPAEAARQLGEVLDQGALLERQGALQLLAELKQPAGDAVLGQQMERLLKQQAPAELHLDILQAAQQRATPALKTQLAQHEAARPKSDPLAPFREALAGGDAEEGRRIFFEKTEVACLRCHKVSGNGGEVGPDLTGIAKRWPRDYLLEAIALPNRQIAKGFESVVVTLNNGQIKTGILKGEDAKEVRLMTAEGQLVAVAKEDIDERQRGPSAMPGDLVEKLSRRELRDLVEFLASLRD